MNQRSLILAGADAAADARMELDVDEFAAIDPYAAAESLGASARFVDVSMEGFYDGGPPPRILISSLRPLRRRAFTCAHEIGHHWFGHGSTLDELVGDDRAPSLDPSEVLAEAFASFLLMPSLGVRSAFARRGWDPTTATAFQVLVVASEFGVGFRTLVTHLAMTMRDISWERRAELLRWQPQRIRKAALGREESSSCLFLDAQSEAASYDIEVGDLVGAPPQLRIEGSPVLRPEGTAGAFNLFRATRQGCEPMRTTAIDTAIRVSKPGYVGRATYRHLEDPDDDCAQS